MGQNRLQIKSLDRNEVNQVNQIENINQITNINIDTESKNYCSKCLSVLGNEMVIDGENNVFCDDFCKREYWLELRQDMDDLISEFR